MKFKHCNRLTGFCSFVSLLEGVREGIQKLGNFLSFPEAMLDTEAALLLPLVLEPEKWCAINFLGPVISHPHTYTSSFIIHHASFIILHSSFILLYSSLIIHHHIGNDNIIKITYKNYNTITIANYRKNKTKIKT